MQRDREAKKIICPYHHPKAVVKMGHPKNRY